MPERLAKHYWLRVQRSFRRVARSSGTANQIALGAAIGMFIGMTPTVSMQMLIAAGVATVFRANRLAAILPVWITNPATVIPIYSFNYWLGLQIVSGPDLGEFTRRFGEVLRAGQDQSFFHGMYLAMVKLAALGWDIQAPLWSGCCLVGVVLALPTYFIALNFVNSFRKRIYRRREERARRYEDLMSHSGSTLPLPPTHHTHEESEPVSPES